MWNLGLFLTLQIWLPIRNHKHSCFEYEELTFMSIKVLIWMCYPVHFNLFCHRKLGNPWLSCCYWRPLCFVFLGHSSIHSACTSQKPHVTGGPGVPKFMPIKGMLPYLNADFLNYGKLSHFGGISSNYFPSVSEIILSNSYRWDFYTVVSEKEPVILFNQMSCEAGAQCVWVWGFSVSFFLHKRSIVSMESKWLW